MIFVTLCSFLIGAVFNLFAGTGAGIAGGVLWWGLIERPAKPTLSRGGLFGFLTVLFAHPFMWFVGAVFGHPIFSAILPHSRGRDLNLLQSITKMLIEGLFGGFMSLLITTFTIPIGVVVGLGLVVLRRRFAP